MDHRRIVIAKLRAGNGKTGIRDLTFTGAAGQLLIDFEQTVEGRDMRGVTARLQAA
jgi:hypothetical protein